MTADPERIAGLTLNQRIFAFAVMCLGFFIALLDIQIVAASLRDIGGGLSAGRDEVVWVQTSYLIAEIIMIPLSGWLAKVLSTRWLFGISAAGFTLFSVLCGLAWNIESMIAFRIMQGFLGGAMIPTVVSTAFAFFPGKRIIAASAAIGAMASLAPTLGPTIGGWITDNYSWHWLFFINVVPGVFISIVVPMLVKIDKPDLSLLRGADYAGILFMALFLGCLEYVLEEGPRYEWLGDDTIRLCTWISSISFVLFVWRSLTAAQPIVDLRAFADPNFALGSLFSFIAGIGLFSTIYLTPLFLGEVEHYSAQQIGLAVFTIGVFQIIGIPIYTFLAQRIDLRRLMMFGMALFGLSLWLYTPITHDWGWRELLLPQALRGFSAQFALAPTVTLTLGALPPARIKLASGLFNLMHNLGGAIGIAACATILENGTNRHFLHLAEHLTTANPALGGFMTQANAHATTLYNGDAVRGHAVALHELWNLTMREAQTQTFSEAYLAVSICFAFATVMVPLMRKVAAPAKPSVNAH